MDRLHDLEHQLEESMQKKVSRCTRALLAILEIAFFFLSKFVTGGRTRHLNMHVHTLPSSMECSECSRLLPLLLLRVCSAPSDPWALPRATVS